MSEQGGAKWETPVVTNDQRRRDQAALHAATAEAGHIVVDKAGHWTLSFWVPQEPLGTDD
jgi:hypothetical protein